MTCRELKTVRKLQNPILFLVKIYVQSHLKNKDIIKDMEIHGFNEYEMISEYITNKNNFKDNMKNMIKNNFEMFNFNSTYTSDLFVNDLSYEFAYIAYDGCELILDINNANQIVKEIYESLINDGWNKFN